MFHPSSLSQSDIINASQRNLKGNFISRDGCEVADVTTLIDQDILRRIFGDFMAVLPEVVGVTKVEEPSLKSIILPK